MGRVVLPVIIQRRHERPGIADHPNDAKKNSVVSFISTHDLKTWPRLKLRIISTGDGEAVNHTSTGMNQPLEFSTRIVLGLTVEGSAQPARCLLQATEQSSPFPSAVTGGPGLALKAYSTTFLTRAFTGLECMVPNDGAEHKVTLEANGHTGVLDLNVWGRFQNGHQLFLKVV